MLYSKALRISRCFSLLRPFWGSHQGFVQSSGLWEAAGNCGGTKGGASFEGKSIAKTRQGRQKSEASAFTSQSEISRIGALSFLWCSFRVKRIAFHFFCSHN